MREAIQPSATFTYARFWRCALQVNPPKYLSKYRGQSHGLSDEAYWQALLEQCKALSDEHFSDDGLLNG